MGAFQTSDFATFLDEAIAAAEPEPMSSPRPTIPFDILSVAAASDRRQSSDARAAIDYLFAAAEDLIEPPGMETPEPPTDAVSVALEIGLTGRESSDQLDRIRRDFAFVNHPDRVAADLRDAAIVRMQIVNRMIDDAKARVRA